MKYKVTMEYAHIGSVEIEANNEQEALMLAEEMDAENLVHFEMADEVKVLEITQLN